MLDGVIALVHLLRKQRIALLAVFLLGLSLSYSPPTAVYAQKGAKHPWHLAASDYEVARNAFYWVKRKRWKEAYRQLKKARDPLIPKLFTWIHYSDGGGVAFKEIAEFTKDNTHWPRANKLIRYTELAIDSKTPAKKVLEWFKEKNGKSYYDPVTPQGKRYLAEAMQKGLKRPNKARITQLLKDSFIGYPFSKKDSMSRFLKKHGKVITSDDYVKRVTHLLWTRKTSEASTLLPKVNKEYRRLFEARLKLILSGSGVDAALRAVPSHLRKDDGLLYDRAVWRKKRKRREGVLEMMLQVNPEPTYPQKFWKLKEGYIRPLLREGRAKDAYKLAANSGLTSGASFARAEWLAGWIALRYLNDAKQAYKHFYKLHENVSTPISLGRAAYWSGRAAEANRNFRIASKWYEVAAGHPTTFYGQLATEKIGLKVMKIPGLPRVSNRDISLYHKNELARAAYIFHNLKREYEANLFIEAAIRHATTAGEKYLITKLGNEMRHPPYSVRAAKEAAQTGHVFAETYFPTLTNLRDVKGRKLDKEMLPLVHALILQESIFDIDAKSRVGALGLMQLMPGTAKLVSRKAKIRYQRNRLTTDPGYNVSLGAFYIDSMLEEWDGSYILAIASYNAGPGNVSKWVKKSGNPQRFDNVEMIVDWIEMIPFKETRNYVQRVLENVQIYRHRLGIERLPYVKLSEDLKA